MFVFGHAGLTLAGVEGLTRARGIKGPLEDAGSLSWVLLFSLLPDIIDKPLAVIFIPHSPSTRLIAHTLLFNLLLWVAVRVIRPSLSMWSLGIFAHLILDQMWRYPHTLLMPLLGWRWDGCGVPEVSFWDFIMLNWQAYSSDWHRLIPEILGMAVLAAALARLVLARQWTPTSKSYHP